VELEGTIELVGCPITSSFTVEKGKENVGDLTSLENIALRLQS
jgi:hypothetical protein